MNVVVEQKPIVWQAHPGPVSSLAFIPGRQGLVSGSNDGHLVWWDVETRAPKMQRAFKYSVFEVAVSPDGAVLGVASGDGTCAVWLLPSGRMRTIGHKGTAYVSAAFSPDGKWYAMVHLFGFVYLWPTGSYTKAKRLKTRGQGSEYYNAYGLGFSPCSRYLAASFTDNTIIVWDLRRRRKVVKELVLDRAGDIAILGSPLQLVIGTVWRRSDMERPYPDSVQVRDFKTGQVLHELEDARAGMAVTSDGRLLACCDLQGGLQLWDTADWRKLASFELPSQSARYTAISPEKDRVACGTPQGYIAVFNVHQD